MDYIQLVKQAEQQRFQALMQQNYQKFQDLCAPELTYIHSSARQDNLSSYMTKLKNQYYIFQQVDYQIENIVEFADTILVFALLDAALLVQQQPLQLKNRTLSVWKKTPAGVQLFAYQPTPIK
jgi:hypothetical protein